MWEICRGSYYLDSFVKGLRTSTRNVNASCLLGLLHDYENGDITFLRNVYKILPASTLWQSIHLDHTKFPLLGDRDNSSTRKPVITFVFCSNVNWHVIPVVPMSVITLIRLLAASFIFYYPAPSHFLRFFLKLRVPHRWKLGILV